VCVLVYFYEPASRLLRLRERKWPKMEEGYSEKRRIVPLKIPARPMRTVRDEEATPFSDPSQRDRERSRERLNGTRDTWKRDCLDRQAGTNKRSPSSADFTDTRVSLTELIVGNDRLSREIKSARSGSRILAQPRVRLSDDASGSIIERHYHSRGISRVAHPVDAVSRVLRVPFSFSVA